MFSLIITQVRELLWARLKLVFELNIDSVKKLNPKSLGTLDTRPHYVRIKNIYDNIIFFQHFLARVFSSSSSFFSFLLLLLLLSLLSFVFLLFPREI